MCAKILVVDDEAPIVDVLTYNLKKAHYEVCIARDGDEAVKQARLEQPDLIILDLMLPKIDGLEVCRILRSERDVPIIMLTARDEEVDRVVGLELGADDYVVKPFSTRELMVRVKNVLRRTASKPTDDSAQSVEVGDLTVDVARRLARLGTIELELTTLEFDVLHVLALGVGRVFTREQLLDKVWGYDYYGDTRVVDAVIKRLRSKLREAAPQDELIATVRSIGYKMLEQGQV